MSILVSFKNITLHLTTYGGVLRDATVMVLTGQTGDGASGLSVTSRLRPRWRLVSAIVHLKLRSVSAFFFLSLTHGLWN